MKHGNLFVEKLSIYKVIKMDNTILKDYSMEVSTQPNNQTKFVPEISFDSKSRENYFEMLEVALRNLSVFDTKKRVQKILVQE